MTRAERQEQFQQLRPLLFSIAYRILGSVTEAEDAVQDTWLRWDAIETTPDSPKAYLSAVVTRVSINVLRSARVRREAYVGPWFPEPLLEDPYQDPERSAELADSISMAALLLLERLSPPERAVFVLREVFGFGYDEIASTVDRSEAACRQLVGEPAVSGILVVVFLVSCSESLLVCKELATEHMTFADIEDCNAQLPRLLRASRAQEKDRVVMGRCRYVLVETAKSPTLISSQALHAD